MKRATAACAALRARSSRSLLAGSPRAHCAFEASQLPEAGGGGCGTGAGPRSPLGRATDPIGSDGPADEGAVTLSVAHALVNSTAKEILVNRNPEARISGSPLWQALAGVIAVRSNDAYRIVTEVGDAERQVPRSKEKQKHQSGDLHGGGSEEQRCQPIEIRV
jgi:hypothetical protein